MYMKVRGDNEKETALLSDFISSDDMLLEDEGTSLICDTREMKNVS